jgi:hypothetical protein
MSWKLANRAVLAFPALPGAYFVGLNFLATAASSNDQAKSLLALQVRVMIDALTSPTSLTCLAFGFVMWIGLIWLTYWGAERAGKRGASLGTLARRLDECGQSIQRLAVLHSQREQLTRSHAWQNQLDYDWLMSNTSLMADYEILYGQQAWSLFNEAKARGIPVDDAHRSIIEHPVNAQGVRFAAQHLSTLAERIRNEW